MTSHTPAYDYTETDTDIQTETERAIAIRAWKAGYNARYHEETAEEVMIPAYPDRREEIATMRTEAIASKMLWHTVPKLSDEDEPDIDRHPDI